jgi:hypothetical protein
MKVEFVTRLVHDRSESEQWSAELVGVNDRRLRVFAGFLLAAMVDRRAGYLLFLLFQESQIDLT